MFDLSVTTASPCVDCPRFLPDATGAVWDGRTLTVWFREAGVTGAGVTTVSVLAAGAVDTLVDRGTADPGTSHAQVEVSWQTTCRVTDDRAATGGVLLPLAPRGRPDPNQPPSGRRTFSVIIRDLDTDAAAYLAGSVTGSRLGR